MDHGRAGRGRRGARAGRHPDQVQLTDDQEQAGRRHPTTPQQVLPLPCSPHRPQAPLPRALKVSLQAKVAPRSHLTRERP